VITQGNCDARDSHGVTGELWCDAFCCSLRQLRPAGGGSDAQGGADVFWLISFNLLEKLQLAHRHRGVRGRGVRHTPTSPSSRRTGWRWSWVCPLWRAVPARSWHLRTASGARFFRPSATAREARPLAAGAPADISAPAMWEMGS